jgi:thiopurine S-methyltransferase
MTNANPSEYWKKRWIDHNTGWHQAEVEPLLESNFKGLTPGGRVLVPLCGKSLDLIWLASQGYDVVGVELSPLACAEFFAENFQDQKVLPERVGKFDRYRAGRVTLYCGNFFDLGVSEVGKIDAVYDRAALIALPQEIRQRYVKHLKSLLASTVSLLLITVEYPGPLDSGPPFSVSSEEVARLYGDRFEIERVDAGTESEITVRSSAGEVAAAQNVFRMSGRAANSEGVKWTPSPILGV